MAIIDNIGVVDEGLRIDKVECLLAVKLMSKSASPMLLAKLEPARNIIAQINLLYLAAHPPSPGFSGLGLLHHIPLPLLNLLHRQSYNIKLY